MRRKPNRELKEYLLKHACKKTVRELTPLVNKEFNETYSMLELQKYLFRNRIPYKYENINKSHCMSAMQIGEEVQTTEGRVKIKLANNIWQYKQRYIYEQYYKVKLTDNDFIVFLDGDKNNFNIDNLYRITRYEGAHLANIYSFRNVEVKDPEMAKLGIAIAKLQVKIKDIKKGED